MRARCLAGLLRFDKFGVIDAVSDIPEGYALFVDYDTDHDTKSFCDISAIARIVDIKPSSVCYKRTRRGWHVIIRLTEKLEPIELVCLQAIYESDPMREALNYMRVKNMHKADAFWRQRWNILYQRKIEK